MADHVQLKDMIVNLIRILVKPAKGIDLIVAAVRDRGVDQTRGSLAQSSGNLWSVTIHAQSALDGGIWHKKGIVGGSGRAWSEGSAR
jgi:hypothetical protein